jgi:hypothetical protein
MHLRRHLGVQGDRSRGGASPFRRITKVVGASVHRGHEGREVTVSTWQKTRRALILLVIAAGALVAARLAMFIAFVARGPCKTLLGAQHRRGNTLR